MTTLTMMWFMAWQAFPEMHSWFSNAKPTLFFLAEYLLHFFSPLAIYLIDVALHVMPG
jgi:hypothetical protein